VSAETNISQRLSELPGGPGVYFHKDAAGNIIYIGKAAVLKNRVRQYFHKSRRRDLKTDALVRDIADIQWVETETELDALFLEAELIRRYMPKYNILLRDDKSLSYVRISYSSDHPTVTLTRRPLDDGARYLGPYYSSFALRRALKYLRRAFPYSTHTGMVPKRDCLQAQIGLCPGLESGRVSLAEYRRDLRQLMRYLKGERIALTKQTEQEMKRAATSHQFEDAARLRNKLHAIRSVHQHIIFSDKERLDMTKDEALQQLGDVLGLKELPRRIEGYDISHMQGSDTVASMVVFVNGVPDKAAYRKFKMRLSGNDDFLHMNEVLNRRLRPANVKQWGVPDLVLIDGGKGQLAAALKARDAYARTFPAISIAKREEDIVVHRSGSSVHVNRLAISEVGGGITESDEYIVVHLPKTAALVKLLQRIRDESHRFAVSYHTVLKRARQTTSQLDEIPTIGPKTKSKLLKAFGSVKSIAQAEELDLARVVGSTKAKLIARYLAGETNKDRQPN
jgi:excinuclease ABC subunit C